MKIYIPIILMISCAFHARAMDVEQIPERQQEPHSPSPLQELCAAQLANTYIQMIDSRNAKKAQIFAHELPLPHAFENYLVPHILHTHHRLDILIIHLLKVFDKKNIDAVRFLCKLNNTDCLILLKELINKFIKFPFAQELHGVIMYILSMYPVGQLYFDLYIFAYNENEEHPTDEIFEFIQRMEKRIKKTIKKLNATQKLEQSVEDNALNIMKLLKNQISAFQDDETEIELLAIEYRTHSGQQYLHYLTWYVVSYAIKDRYRLEQIKTLLQALYPDVPSAWAREAKLLELLELHQAFIEAYPKTADPLNCIINDEDLFCALDIRYDMYVCITDRILTYCTPLILQALRQNNLNMAHKIMCKAPHDILDSIFYTLVSEGSILPVDQQEVYVRNLFELFDAHKLPIEAGTTRAHVINLRTNLRTQVFYTYTFDHDAKIKLLYTHEPRV